MRKKIERNPFPNGDYIVMVVETQWKKIRKQTAYWIVKKVMEKNETEKVVLESVPEKSFWVKPELVDGGGRLEECSQRSQ